MISAKVSKTDGVDLGTPINLEMSVVTLKKQDLMNVLWWLRLLVFLAIVMMTRE